MRFVAGAQFVHTGAHSKVLVIGADKMTSIVDPHDRATSILFGDGAGGVLLEPSEDEDVGLLDFELHADGSGAEDLYIKGGGSANSADP